MQSNKYISFFKYNARIINASILCYMRRNTENIVLLIVKWRLHMAFHQYLDMYFILLISTDGGSWRLNNMRDMSIVWYVIASNR